MIRPALIIILMMLVSTAFAQSGRVTPQPTPSSTPSRSAIKQPEAKPRFVIDAKADKYKFLFVTSYSGTRLTVGEEAANQGRHSRLENFIGLLNQAGAQGYRLVSVTNGWNPVAIVKLDEAQYEYARFETVSPYFFSKSGFEEKYAGLSKLGFELVSHFFISKFCKDSNGAVDNIQIEDCEYRDLFLIEREKGAERPRHHALAVSGPGWRARMGDVLTKQINEHLVAGFRPTHALSKFEILLQHVIERDEFTADKSKVQVVTSPNWGFGGVQKKVNELAREGYRLAIVSNGIAVMRRNEEGAPPASYVWVNAERKGFEKELAKLLESGAVYRMTCPDKHGMENQLIFEQQAGNVGRREYKVLMFEFQITEDGVQKKVYIDLTPSTKEGLRLLNELAGEGFAVRGLFSSEKLGVVLERRLDEPTQ